MGPIGGINACQGSAGTMPEPDQEDRRDERRLKPRYRVELETVAHRTGRHLPPSVPAHVPVTIINVSCRGLCWHAKEVFYSGELVGLALPGGEDGPTLKCVVRVCRTRRIRNQYETAGVFVHVRREESEASTDTPADETPEPAATAAS